MSTQKLKLICKIDYKMSLNNMVHFTSMIQMFDYWLRNHAFMSIDIIRYNNGYVLFINGQKLR